jgi:hypothetical protein
MAFCCSSPQNISASISLFSGKSASILDVLDLAVAMECFRGSGEVVVAARERAVHYEFWKPSSCAELLLDSKYAMRIGGRFLKQNFEAHS